MARPRSPRPACGSFLAGGFTLVELMFSIAIAMILAAVAVPSFRGMIERQRLSIAVNAFHSAILQARAEAMSSGVPVRLAPLTSSDWLSGWQSWVDTNQNTQRDANEPLIFQHDALPAGLRVDGGASSIVFTPFGRASQLDSWTFTGSDGSMRKLILNFLGRPRICDPVATPLSCPAPDGS